MYVHILLTAPHVEHTRLCHTIGDDPYDTQYQIVRRYPMLYDRNRNYFFDVAHDPYWVSPPFDDTIDAPVQPYIQAPRAVAVVGTTTATAFSTVPTAVTPPLQPTAPPAANITVASSIDATAAASGGCTATDPATTTTAVLATTTPSGQGDTPPASVIPDAPDMSRIVSSRLLYEGSSQCVVNDHQWYFISGLHQGSDRVRRMVASTAMFDMKHHRWHTSALPEIPMPVAFATAIVVKERIYLFGTTDHHHIGQHTN